MNSRPVIPCKAQRGAVLVLCLVMLLALTFIGVASMSNSTLQERIVGGARDNNLAFQAAESALLFGVETSGKHVQTVTNFNRFLDEVACPAVPTSFWAAPSDLAAIPKIPECRFRNYYAEYIEGLRGGVDAFTPPPPVCIKRGEASGSAGLNPCQPGSPLGLLMSIDASGYGSNATVHLRSVYQVLKEDID